MPKWYGCAADTAVIIDFMNRATALMRRARDGLNGLLLCLPAAALPQGFVAPGFPPPALSSPSPPVRIEAQSLSGSVAATAVAEGAVELRRGPVLLRADRLTYRRSDETVQAEGRVSLSQGGDVFRGPALTVHLPDTQGVFLQPEFDLGRTGAGGRAERIEFQGPRRFQARQPMYTGCPRDGSGDPDWLITARHLSVDLEANEAVAQGAVLRFLGVPVLGLPWISFPATSERKSGWLSPHLRADSRSGLELGVPWYWNIAPDRDATLTPRHIAKRGPGMEAEFRYLGPSYSGQVDADMTPNDALADRRRHALNFHHGSMWSLPGAGGVARLDLRAVRASDNDWWKDYRRDILGLTPRLLPAQVGFERSLPWRGVQAAAYARMQRWQALQSVDDLFTPPYQRAFQGGLRVASAVGTEWEWTAETEVNRFTLPEAVSTVRRPTGQRVHVLAEIARPWRSAAGWLVPRLSLNAAAYELDAALADGRRRVGRTVPTLSVDAGWTLEREAVLLGRPVRQTLEPRLVYVYTPWRDQRPELLFDSSGRDFNIDSIFATGDFSGIDRVSDANHLNAGAVTRFVDAVAGQELLRLGLVQRFLFSDQQITPEGVPFTGRFSDLFLLGSIRAIPAWSLDGALRWNAELGEAVRSVVTARYAPAAGRTVGLTQRTTLGQSRQWELSWQWPLQRVGAAQEEPAADPTCRRRWSTLGALNYSDRDRQLVSSKVGLQVDAGCWTGRLAAERVTVGPSDALVRFSFQLQLNGLGSWGGGF